MKNQQRRLALPLSALALASLALVGCGRNDDQAVNTDRDSTVAKVERNADAAAAKVERGIDNTAAATRDAAHDAKVASQNAAKEVGDKVSDAVITTAVNAELAKDDKLSALKIDVDTTDGRVLLKGTAPSAADKDRATQLAQGVKGVTGVDNQLRVEPS